MVEYTKVNPDDIDIDITDEMVEETFKSKKLREGIMRGRCTAAENVIAGTGSYMGRLVYNPVDENDNVRGPAVRTNFVYPFANGDFTREDGSVHEAPDTAKRCKRYLESVMEDCPRLARWIGDDKVFETPDGDILEPEDGRLYNLDVRKQITYELRARLKDSDRFLGDECYIKIVWKDKKIDDTGKEVGGWPEIQTVFATPPADAEVIVDNFGVKS